MAEFLSPPVTEPSTKAYDCYSTKESLEGFIHSEIQMMVFEHVHLSC